MKTLGSRLLHKPFLAGNLKRLSQKLVDSSQGIVLYQPGVTADELRSQLQDLFCLEPLALGALQEIRVEVTSRGSASNLMRAYLAEGRLTYSGSRVLWQANPQRGLGFPFRGVAADTSVGLRKLIPSLDVEPFRDELEETLTRTREALLEFAPVVKSYDEVIRSKIDRTIKSWL
jgi:hypothetical protein